MKTSTPMRSTPGGSSVEGPTTRTRAPSAESSNDVRARDARMQDVAADRDGEALDPALVAPDRQRVEQRLRRMLMRAVAGIDDRAIDLLGQKMHRAGLAWRTTMMSGRMAFSVIAVSISVSPFLTLEVATDMFMTSAPRRLPASSKDDWVRVEASKKRLIKVRPRKVERFFSTWRDTSIAASARSRRKPMSCAESPSIPSRCRCGNAGSFAGLTIDPVL